MPYVVSSLVIHPRVSEFSVTATAGTATRNEGKRENWWFKFRIPAVPPGEQARRGAPQLLPLPAVCSKVPSPQDAQLGAQTSAGLYRVLCSQIARHFKAETSLYLFP